MPKRIIQPVKDNTDKKLTYAHQMRRYKLAMEHTFYFEAMMIVYGMLEDRLRSFLYHAGALANRNASKINFGKTKTEIKNIVTWYDPKKNVLGISNISGKIKIVRSMVLWAAYTENCPKDNKYLRTLKNQLEGIDLSALEEMLEQIEHWCMYRNEVIHALMNKNLESLHAELKTKVELGMVYARFLDNTVKTFKKGNRVRRSVNLTMN